MWKWINPEIALGVGLASMFWACVLGWQAAYAPTERIKNECYEAAQKSGHKTEECKSFWERTTSDPVALFTFVLSVSTIGLWAVTWRSGARQTRDMEGAIAAANEANRLNRENMIASQRAWLSIEDVKLKHPTQFTEDFMGFAVDATIKNLGKTPATSVEVMFESYFSGGSEKFMDAVDKFKAKLRRQPAQLGHLLFPEDSLTYGLRWADGKEKFAQAITTRPSGERKFGFSIFVGVSYRIAGDPNAHITYLPHDAQNVLIGTTMPEGKTVDLPRMPFIAGEAD